MLAAQLLEPGRIEFRECTPPAPRPGEVVVRIRAALACGTDLKAYRRGDDRLAFPLPLGREFSGDVAAIGQGVTGFGPGDPVMAVHSAPCNDCRQCRRGRTQLCEHLFRITALGAFSEYLQVSEPIVRQNMFPKPAHLPYAEAAFLGQLACVVHGLQVIAPCRTAAILGCGSVGLLHLLALRRWGAERILVTGKHPERLDLARDLGADEVIDIDHAGPVAAIRDFTGGQGAELVVDCCGQPESWESSLWMVAKGGTLRFFGGCPGGARVRLDTTRLHYDQITVRGACHFTPEDVREACELLVSGAFPVGRLLSGSYALRELPEVFRRLDRGEGIKYVLEP